MASPAAKNLLLQCMAKLPPLKRLGASLVVRSGNNTPEIHAVSDPYLSSARPFPNLAGGDCAKDVGAMIYFCSSASGLKTPVIEEGGGLPSVCLPIPLISMDGARAEFEVRPSEERRTAGAKRQLSTGPPSHKTCYLQSVASLLASPMIPTLFAIRFAHRSETLCGRRLGWRRRRRRWAEKSWTGGSWRRYTYNIQWTTNWEVG